MICACVHPAPFECFCWEEIATLKAENERLREALNKIKDRECACYFVGDSSCCHYQDQEVAEEALAPKQEGKTGER